MEILADAEQLLGECPETLRARDNFALHCPALPDSLLRAVLELKLAAARVSDRLGYLESGKAAAIETACRALLARKTLQDLCPLPALQGGAGTSTNANCNEVIAALASRHAGTVIHPNDDVNRFQSTNDIFPTALRIAALRELALLERSLAELQEGLQNREREFTTLLKLGRTQLQDAVPVTLGQEFGAWAEAVARDRWRIDKCRERLRLCNLGGTAVGTGTTAPKNFIFAFVEEARTITGLPLARAENGVDVTQNADLFSEVSGMLRTVAVNFQKIAADIRLLASGPAGGIGEIILAPLQAGSTIMPGKVNPVLPELLASVAIQVMGNDLAVNLAAASGQLELNAFLPVLARNLLESLTLLGEAAVLFTRRCVARLEAAPDRCRSNLETGYALVTLLAPYVGYDGAAAIWQQAREKKISVRAAALASGLFTEDELALILDPRRATAPGIPGAAELRARLEARLLAAQDDGKAGP